MIRINLLPKEKKKAAIEINRGLVFGTLGVLVLLFILFAVTQWQRMKISELEESITQANEELVRLKPILDVVDQITKMRNTILTRKQIIEKLDAERGMEVHLTQDMSERLPDYVWLSNMTQIQDNNGLRQDLTGYGFSIKHIETFLVQLFKSPMYSDVALANITADFGDKKQRIYRFVVNTKIRPDWLAQKTGISPPDSTKTSTGSAPSGGLIGKGRDALKMDPEASKKAMQGMKN